VGFIVKEITMKNKYKEMWKRLKNIIKADPGIKKDTAYRAGWIMAEAFYLATMKDLENDQQPIAEETFSVWNMYITSGIDDFDEDFICDYCK